MKFLALFRRRRQREQELDEEIRAHLALPIRERIEQGENPAEAEVNAKHEFGNVTMIKEVTRDMWRWGWLETLFQDLRYGLRQLRRSPGFTAVAVVTLALGIGANAAIFSVVDGVLIHPLPFDNSSQLVMLWQRVQHFGANSFTTPDFLAWKKQAFMSIAATSEESFNISEGNGTEHVPGGPVSANFFSILGVKPIGGRGFLPDEDQQNGRRVVILSYGLWQRDFGGDLAVMGKALDLNGQPFTVIGIMPRGFRNGLQLAAQLWVPLESDPTFSTTRQTRSVHWLLVMGRLKANATLEQARAAMTAIAGSLGKEYPETDARLGVDVTPLADYIVGSIRPALLTLFVAVGLVLLIACANVANLLLAQATARAKEMAVRIAVGAGRARLVRQLLTESVLLATLGGALGLFFAFWSLSVLRRMNSGDIPRLKQISIDPGVLVFGVALCVGTGVLFGAAPAIQASKADLNETLKEGGRTSDIGSGRVEFRHLLVVSEVALSLILLVGAGLMIRSFSSLQQAPLGFNPHRLLTMQLSFTQPGHSAQETPLFYEQVLDRVRSLPGVESAAIARDLPLIGANPSSPFSIAGRPVASPEQRPIARYRA
ncbi:MAG: ADOP family duplicated permease, partial [Terriglobia bacterium]